MECVSSIAPAPLLVIPPSMTMAPISRSGVALLLLIVNVRTAPPRSSTPSLLPEPAESTCVLPVTFATVTSPVKVSFAAFVPAPSAMAGLDPPVTFNPPTLSSGAGGNRDIGCSRTAAWS